MKNPIFLIFLILIVVGFAIKVPEDGRNILFLLIMLVIALFALAVLIKDPRKKKQYFQNLFYGGAKDKIDKTNNKKK